MIPSARFVGALSASLVCGLAVGAEEFFTYSGYPLRQVPAEVTNNLVIAQPVGDRLRVASYNTEHFTDGLDDGPERTAEMVRQQAAGVARLVDRIAPDVLVMQEIENAQSVRALNERLAQPFPVAYITHLGEESQSSDKLNLAVLSRVPVLEPRELDFGPLTGPGRPTRGLLRFALELGGDRRLLVYVLHLKSNFGNKPRNIAQREAALRILREDADALARKQPQYQWEMMALGDTNVDPEVPEFALDTSFRPLADWVDVWRGHPMPARASMPTRRGDPALEFPPATFDRIFVSPALTNSPWVVRGPGVLQEGCDTNNVFSLPGAGIHTSDHFPVYIDLTR